jgi:hypothetical protein
VLFQAHNPSSDDNRDDFFSGVLFGSGSGSTDFTAGVPGAAGKTTFFKAATSLHSFSEIKDDFLRTYLPIIFFLKSFLSLFFQFRAEGGHA